MIVEREKKVEAFLPSTRVKWKRGGWKRRRGGREAEEIHHTSFKPFPYFDDFVSSLRYGKVNCFSSCDMRSNEKKYICWTTYRRFLII
jgi:hypothetical protein